MHTRLVQRITFGVTEDQLEVAASLGYSGYLEYQLNYAALPDAAALARLQGLATLNMSYPQLVATGSLNAAINELIEAALVRAHLSERQLYERMVEFWTDHFNIDSNTQAFLKVIDDRTVIRPNALGTFPGLLNASARSPAMLAYLNNSASTANSITENYARELLELHTLGVDGGYTQRDIEEIARCLTGWTIYPDNAGAQAGAFFYKNSVHDQGVKQVLGRTIPANGGMQDGITILNILATHPSTARFIAGKLCRKFLGADVPLTVIDTVATAYTATGGDIKAMLRAALRPEHLFDSTPRYKRPFHFMVSAMRATGATLDSSAAMRALLETAGHLPFSWNPPDGYPDTFDYWAGLLLARWNYGSTSVSGGVWGLNIDASSFFAGLSSASAMADRINTRLFAGRMPAAERNLIRDYLRPDPPTPARQREALGLAISSPGFQWY